MKKIIEIPIYGTKVHCFIGTDRDKVVKYGKKKFNTTLSGMFLAGTTWEVGTEYIIWVNQKDDIGSISHELLHCTFKILNHIGINHSRETEEAFTYLHTYLLRELI